MIYEDFPAKFEEPVYICECCGNLLRLLFCKGDEEVQCNFCGCFMTKTDRKLSDAEGYLMYYSTKDARVFQRDIFQKYVTNSERYDLKLHTQREIECRRMRQRFF